jgi:hypothetical protein
MIHYLLSEGLLLADTGIQTLYTIALLKVFDLKKELFKVKTYI